MKCHGGVNTITEMPVVFRKSRINLNLTTRSIKTGLSQRIWDVLACRGFLITNYQEEIPGFLQPGRHLVMYEDYDELKELIRFYMTHEEEREEIAVNGYNEVKARGKVLDRVIDMIRAIAG